MKLKQAFIFTLIILTLSVYSTAIGAEKEKMPFKHILVLGADRPFSNADLNKLSPMIAYYYFMEDFESDLYGQFTLRTTNVYFILGLKNKKYYTGLKPQLNHHVYGAYHSYYKGVSDETRIFKSHNAGGEFFFKYNLAKYFSSWVSYYPNYRFYQKNEEAENFYSKSEETEIDLPSKHWEHEGVLKLDLGHVAKKDLSRIKHGIILSGKYKFIKRVGYGTFEDIVAAEDSDIDTTHKLYMNLGAYYNASGFNLQIDVYGGFHKNVDRNNAEQIGYFLAEHAVMPGYFFGEFYHDRYLISRTQIGIPLGFWGARIQPGFNILYMPKKNRVVGGVGDEGYPRKTYKSVSVDFSIKLGNLLPLFLSYAYGMDAERIDIKSESLKEEKGNHEVRAFVLMAFGKN